MHYLGLMLAAYTGLVSAAPQDPNAGATTLGPSRPDIERNTANICKFFDKTFQDNGCNGKVQECVQRLTPKDTNENERMSKNNYGDFWLLALDCAGREALVVSPSAHNLGASLFSFRDQTNRTPKFPGPEHAGLICERAQTPGKENYLQCAGVPKEQVSKCPGQKCTQPSDVENLCKESPGCGNCAVTVNQGRQTLNDLTIVAECSPSGVDVNSTP